MHLDVVVDFSVGSVRLEIPLIFRFNFNASLRCRLAPCLGFLWTWGLQANLSARARPFQHGDLRDAAALGICCVLVVVGGVVRVCQVRQNWACFDRLLFHCSCWLLAFLRIQTVAHDWGLTLAQVATRDRTLKNISICSRRRVGRYLMRIRRARSNRSISIRLRRNRVPTNNVRMPWVACRSLLRVLNSFSFLQKFLFLLQVVQHALAEADTVCLSLDLSLFSFRRNYIIRLIAITNIVFVGGWLLDHSILEKGARLPSFYFFSSLCEVVTNQINSIFDQLSLNLFVNFTVDCQRWRRIHL